MLFFNKPLSMDRIVKIISNICFLDFQVRYTHSRKFPLSSFTIPTRVAHSNNRLKIVPNQRNLISVEASPMVSGTNQSNPTKNRLDKPVVIPKQQFPSRIPAVKSRPYNQHVGPHHPDYQRTIIIIIIIVIVIVNEPPPSAAFRDYIINLL